MIRSVILLLVTTLALSGCFYGTPNYNASDDAIKAAAYVHNGPSSITLFTSVNSNSGAGAHSGLMINASERILYDPAGRFTYEDSPERADVHYGFSDWALVNYFAHHTLPTHHLRMQTIIVTPEIAELAYSLARQEGRSVDAACASHSSNILAQIPGLGFSKTVFPRNLSEQFAKLPNVIVREVYEGERLVP